MSTGQGPPVTGTSLGVVFPLHRVLVLPSVLQSAVSGQVTSVGMLMCVAKQNRCRKICQSRDRVGGRACWGQTAIMAVFIDWRAKVSYHAALKPLGKLSLHATVSKHIEWLFHCPSGV